MFDVLVLCLVAEFLDFVFLKLVPRESMARPACSLYPPPLNGAVELLPTTPVTRFCLLWRLRLRGC